MKTLLLLAGQSKRFWPLAEKPLFPIAGKALIAHVVDRLKEGGCTDITLVGGKHNLEEVRQLFPGLPTIEQEDLSLGMRGAMFSALPHVGSEPVLVVSSNDIVEPSAYQSVIKAGEKKGGAILAQRVKTYFPGGYLSVEGNRVTGIVEKPGEGKEPSDLVTIVCHYHSDPALLLKLLKDVSSTKDDGYERALAEIFKEKDYEAVPYEGGWQAVKYPWHLLQVLPMMLSGIKAPSIHATATVHPTAVIEGNVVLEEGVRVLPHAVIVGPTTIGKHSIIGNNALVRGSSVGEHCVVGYNTEAKSSVLSHHVWMHSTYIGDSVIGENVSFGAGTVTGNLRLDEGEISSFINDQKIPTGLNKFGTAIGNGCRVGIRVGINPGVKIGAGTFVGSGAIISEDIPDKSFAVMKAGELMVRPNAVSAPHPAEREKYRKGI